MSRIVDFLGCILEPRFGKNNFGEENIGIKVWNKDSQVLDGVPQENELEQAEFGENGCILTNNADEDSGTECVADCCE